MRSRRWLPRTLRGEVALVMVAVAVTSLLAVSVINVVVTDDLLEGEATDELLALQRSRSQAITDGLRLRREATAVLAADRSVVEALVDFGAAIDDLEATGPGLDGAELASIRAAYEASLADGQLIDSVTAAGLVAPELDQLLPADPVAAYLQYHYLVPDIGDRQRRIAVDDAGDGSTYSAVHAEHHPFLRDAAQRAGLRDLMLVTLDGNRIVYSVGKGSDLGADAIESVFGDGGLSPVLADELPRARVGDAVIVDVHPYLGALGQPVLFIAAAVRDGREVIGTLIAQLPVDPLNTLMTADGMWEEVGLGDTGETYVVGRDLRLRSDARGWIEDPEGYVADLRSNGSDDAADATERSGSTVLSGIVDTAPVRTALDGNDFVGSSTNAQGERVIAVASPLSVSGLDWVVVAEIATSEATAESAVQLRRLLLLAAVLLPVVAVAGVVLARRLTRPVGPLVTAAEAVAAGDREVALDDRSRDEFGHLARELSSYAAALARQDAELVEQHRAVDDLLGALLPPRVVDAVRQGTIELGDLVDTATVVAVTIDGIPEEGEDVTVDHAWFVARELERLASEHGLERIWSSSDRHVFAAGLGVDHHGADAALQFVAGARAALIDVPELAELGLELHGGVAAGMIATGVVGGAHVSYGITGRAAARALGLDAVGSPGTVLVDHSVVAHLRGNERVGGRRREVDLGGVDVEAIELDVSISTTP